MGTEINYSSAQNSIAMHIEDLDSIVSGNLESFAELINHPTVYTYYHKEIPCGLAVYLDSGVKHFIKIRSQEKGHLEQAAKELNLPFEEKYVL
tara:strand:- start:1062 stop:1340 length:279 start_codon:yes stop_codon:yes gene_type:complete